MLVMGVPISEAATFFLHNFLNDWLDLYFLAQINIDHERSYLFYFHQNLEYRVAHVVKIITKQVSEFARSLLGNWKLVRMTRM